MASGVREGLQRRVGTPWPVAGHSEGGGVRWGGTGLAPCVGRPGWFCTGLLWQKWKPVRVPALSGNAETQSGTAASKHPTSALNLKFLWAGMFEKARVMQMLSAMLC